MKILPSTYKIPVGLGGAFDVELPDVVALAVDIGPVIELVRGLIESGGIADDMVGHAKEWLVDAYDAREAPIQQWRHILRWCCYGLAIAGERGAELAKTVEMPDIGVLAMASAVNFELQKLWDELDAHEIGGAQATDLAFVRLVIAGELASYELIPGVSEHLAFAMAKASISVLDTEAVILNISSPAPSVVESPAYKYWAMANRPSGWFAT